MHVPEIIEVKEHLEKLKGENIIESWELPYENILTRRSAAIFFVDTSDDKVTELTKALNGYQDFSYRINSEKNLSKLKYRITFSSEEKEKNENAVSAEG